MRRVNSSCFSNPFSSRICTGIAAAAARHCASKPASASPAGSPSSSDAEGTAPIPPAAAASSQSRDQFLAAVKDRNFGAAQAHAVTYVQSQWKEEYLLPLACVLVLLIVRYWLASGQRKVQRLCDAAESKSKADSESLREQVRGLATRWQRDIRSRENQVQTVFDKNSEMTRTIDSLAAALKSCAPRAFGASLQQQLP